MNSMVRERENHVPVLYIAITPDIRRALEMLAEASISLLDEIERPIEGVEDIGDDEPSLGWTTTQRGVLIPGDCTDDREFDDSDDEESDPAEEDDPGEQNGDLEHDLGWTEEGFVGGFDAGETDFHSPEASGDFNRADYGSNLNTTAQKALFKTAPRPEKTPSRWMVDEQVRMLRLKLQKMRKR